jgi:hypothetical protein
LSLNNPDVARYLATKDERDQRLSYTKADLERRADVDAIVARFWSAHPDALFTRNEVALVRRCSVALMEREAWAGTGIPMIRDGSRALHRKRDVLARLGLDPDQAA